MKMNIQTLKAEKGKLYNSLDSAIKSKRGAVSELKTEYSVITDSKERELKELSEKYNDLMNDYKYA